jgi:hypothetical protein
MENSIMKPIYLIYAMAAVMLFFFIMGEISDRRSLNLSLQGVVQKVEYSENKGTPTVTVNNETYFLGGPFDFNYGIGVGDTIFKKKGEQIFKIIKKGSGKMIDFHE